MCYPEPAVIIHLENLGHRFKGVTVSITIQRAPAAEEVKVSSAETSVNSRSSSLAASKAYDLFLDKPVTFVLGVLWLAGAALIGLWGLVLYLIVSALI